MPLTKPITAEDLNWFLALKSIDQITDSDWPRVRALCAAIDGRHTLPKQKLKVLCTISDPHLSNQEKRTAVQNFKVASRFFKTRSGREQLANFTNEATIKFLSERYPQQDFTLLLYYRNVPGNIFHHWLVAHNSGYRKKLQTIGWYRKHNFMGLAMAGVDLTSYYSADEITKRFQEVLDRLIAGGNVYRDYLIYQAHRLDFNKMVYRQYPQLEMFPQLFSHNRAGSGKLRIDFWQRLSSQNLKPFLKKKFGFNSARFIKFLKTNYSNLDEALVLSANLSYYRKLIKDSNYIWQLLIGEVQWPRQFRVFTPADLRVMDRYQACFTDKQWVDFLLKLYQALSQHPEDVTEAGILRRNFKDSLAMITQVTKIDGTNPIIESLRTHYRYQDYNTVAKLHEVCTRIYNRLQHSEYSLGLHTNFPELLEHHQQDLVPGLSWYIPQTNLDYHLWGDQLNICVGAYGRKVQAGETLVLGLYEQEKIKYCLEFSPETKEIRQLKGSSNHNAPAVVFKAVRQWLQSVDIGQTFQTIRRQELLTQIKQNHQQLKSQIQDFQNAVGIFPDTPRIVRMSREYETLMDEALHPANLPLLVDAEYLKTWACGLTSITRWWPQMLQELRGGSQLNDCPATNNHSLVGISNYLVMIIRSLMEYQVQCLFASTEQQAG